MIGASSARTATLRRKSAPLLLVERARAEPATLAYRAKRFGLYEERTWRDYAERVGRCAQSFAALGVTRGERVAIMGDACEEWLLADLGAQALGAITYGIYPTASASELEYQMADGGAVVFVAENQEYVDKILPLAERLPALRHVVVIDDAAMFDYRHPQLVSWRELMRRSEGAPDALDALARCAAELDPDAPAFIVYTSGTTGHPKGALVAHGKHLAATFGIVDIYPTLAAKSHRTVAYLPLCHVLGRDVAITLPLISSLTPHFGEDLEDLPQTLFDVAPTVLFAVPRYLQKFAAQVLVAIANTSPLKRKVYEAALAYARAHARRRWEGSVGAADRMLYRLWHAAAFRPALNKLGFDQLELMVSGGAALPAESMALWQILGVNVVEMYGQTETAGGIISAQRGPFARPGNVGIAPPGWEVRLAANGEILVRSPHLFEGYWRDTAATRAVLDQDGWLHTGDVGELADGTLTLVDRVRDFIVTSGGKTLSPSHIENALRGSPFISEVIVFGHARKYVSALVEIEYDTVADWARAHDISYAGFTSLAEHPEVKRLLEEEIARANRELARVEQVKAFRVLPKALDPEEEGEPVTPTRKVKRKLMYERFRTLVDGMYDDQEERMVAQGAGSALDN